MDYIKSLPCLYSEDHFCIIESLYESFKSLPLEKREETTMLLKEAIKESKSQQVSFIFNLLIKEGELKSLLSSRTNRYLFSKRV